MEILIKDIKASPVQSSSHDETPSVTGENKSNLFIR